MSKQIKSVRFNDDVVEVFEQYSALGAELFGTKESFGAFVNEAVAKLLYERTEAWVGSMGTDSFVEVKPNGRIKKLQFSDSQIQSAKELFDSALSAYAPYLGI